MKFKPVGQRLLIERNSQTTMGGLIIPDEVLEGETTFQGKVVSLSDELENTRIKVGDTVYYSKYGIDITLEGKEYLLLSIEYVLAVVKE